MKAVMAAPRAPKQKIVAMAWLIGKSFSQTELQSAGGNLRQRQGEDFLAQYTNGNGRQHSVDRPPHQQASNAKSTWSVLGKSGLVTFSRTCSKCFWSPAGPRGLALLL